VLLAAGTYTGISTSGYVVLVDYVSYATGVLKLPLVVGLWRCGRVAGWGRRVIGGGGRAKKLGEDWLQRIGPYLVAGDRGM
jgi:hypothetical protein